MLTDTEARSLLHLAADTIEVEPAHPFVAPPRRPRSVWMLAAAAALVLLVATGVLAWRGDRPAPAHRPDGQILVPSVLGYPTDAAQRLLEAAGLRPLVRTQTSCTDSGRALGTDPAPGTALAPGTLVALLAADGTGLRCPYSPSIRQHDDAWRLIDLARGVGPGPHFAPYLTMGVTNGRDVTVPADPRTGPAQWLACPDDDPGCPGTVLDVLAHAVATTATVDGRAVGPELVTGDYPKPWAFGGGAVTAFRFLVDIPHDGPRHPQWSVDAYYDSLHRLVGVDLHWGRRDATDPEPASGPPGVGPDPQDLGRRFVAFASDSSRARRLPIDSPVRLYLDNQLVKTISDRSTSRPQAWTVCRGVSEGCPSSALGAVVALELSYGISFSTAVPAPSACLDTSGAPRDTGGNHVLVIDSGSAPASCRGVYEVQIYSNDVNQIVAVNLLTPSGSSVSASP